MIAEWIANQITEACGWEQAPCYLIRDRDGAYGETFTRRLRSMGIRDRPTSPRSPWQNGYAERLIGSIRRECIDHIIVLGERHLRHVLLSYMKYYNKVRTHLSLEKDAPVSRPIERAGHILCRPILGGLHHQYGRILFTIGTACVAFGPCRDPLSSSAISGANRTIKTKHWEDVHAVPPLSRLLLGALVPAAIPSRPRRSWSCGNAVRACGTCAGHQDPDRHSPSFLSAVLSGAGEGMGGRPQDPTLSWRVRLDAHPRHRNDGQERYPHRGGVARLHPRAVV